MGRSSIRSLGRQLSEVGGSPASLRDIVVRGGVGGVAIKVSFALLSVAVAVLLARALGASGYGVYAYVVAIVSLLAVPAQFGLRNLVVRETAQGVARGEWGVVRGLWRWANAVALLGILAVGGSALLVAWAMADRFTSLELTVFGWGLVLLPMIAFGALRASALRGLGKVIQGLVPEQVMVPGLLVLFVGGALLLLPAELTPVHAMALHAAAAGLAFLWGAWLLLRARPRPLIRRPRPAPIYRGRLWLAAALPLALAASFQLVNRKADLLLLGIFATAEDVGIYSVAVQGAALATLALTGINSVLAPHFARLHAEGSTEQLQRLVVLGARAILVLSLPVVLVLVFFGEPVLDLVFGGEYATGYRALAILAIGKLLHAAVGTVGHLLVMTGFERETAWTVGIAASANILLNVILIPPFGIEGAAVASTLTFALWQGMLWRLARRRLGIEGAAFASLKRHGE